MIASGYFLSAKYLSPLATYCFLSTSGSFEHAAALRAMAITSDFIQPDIKNSPLAHDDRLCLVTPPSWPPRSIAPSLPRHCTTFHRPETAIKSFRVIG